MKARTPAKLVKNFDYPDETSGSKKAERVRSEANTITEEERSAMFELGKRLIYGGNGSKKAVRG